MKKLFIFLAAYTIVLPATIKAQPQIKENIEEIKNKINGFATSLASIKNNTDGLANMAKALKEKADILSPDLLTGDAFENLKEGLQEFKSRITAEASDMKKFRGPDLKCGPGSECFKFKKDISDIFASIEDIKKSLFGSDAGLLAMGNNLNEIINQSPGFGLFPVYEILGQAITVLSKNMKELSNNIDALMAFSKNYGSAPSGIFKGSGIKYYDKESFRDYAGITAPSLTDEYFPVIEIKNSYSAFNDNGYVSPNNPNSIDTNKVTIQLADQCKDRPKLGSIINKVRVALKVVNVIAKHMEESEAKEFQFGGSFVGHAAVTLRLNSIKKIGISLEVLFDTIDQVLDNVSGNLDQCDNMMAAKAIADNQKTIIDNQKLLFETLSRNGNNPGNSGGNH